MFPGSTQLKLTTTLNQNILILFCRLQPPTAKTLSYFVFPRWCKWDAVLCSVNHCRHILFSSHEEVLLFTGPHRPVGAHKTILVFCQRTHHCSSEVKLVRLCVNSDLYLMSKRSSVWMNACMWTLQMFKQTFCGPLAAYLRVICRLFCLIWNSRSSNRNQFSVPKIKSAGRESRWLYRYCEWTIGSAGLFTEQKTEQYDEGNHTEWRRCWNTRSQSVTSRSGWIHRASQETKEFSLKSWNRRLRFFTPG